MSQNKAEVKENVKIITGINLRIADAKANIANAINSADLPPGISLTILESIIMQLRMQNEMMIAEERKEMEKGEKQNGD